MGGTQTVTTDKTEKNITITSYRPTQYWSARFRQYGHTGFRDPLKHRYSQPLRLKAVEWAVGKFRLITGEGAQFLDAGCGPGDFIELFLKMDAKVVGIDASLEVVKEARRRFAGNDMVRVEVGHIEALTLPDEAFDLVITVTVLQHIVDVHEFIRAVKNLVRVTHRDGHILIFEVAPEELSERWPSMSHLTVRTRNEYIKVFEETGAILIHEMCIPEIGIRLLTSYDNLVASLRAKLFRSSRAEMTSSTSSRLQNFIKKSILLLSKPFDYLFLWLPFPKGYSDMRILIFKRVMD